MAEVLRSPISPATNTRRVVRLGSLPRLNVIDPEVPVQPVESLQKLQPPDSADCHAFLDFAENGTVGKLSRFGELAQLGKLVTTTHTTAPSRFIIADPRSVAPNYRQEGLDDSEQDDAYQTNENEDADDDNVVDHDYETKYFQRYGNFLDVSNGIKRGFGLRLAEPDSIRDLEAFYRNDKHPEIRYSIDGKADAIVTVGIKDGQVVQQVSLKSTSQTLVQIELLFDFSIALGEVPYSKFDYEEGVPYERPAEKCIKIVTKNGQAQWVLFNYDYQISAAFFCNGKFLDFNINDIKQVPNSEIDIAPALSESLLHRENVYLRPGQQVTYTAIFKQSALGNNLHELGSALDFVDTESLVRPPVPDMWWRFKTLDSSFIHRRALESVLTHFLPQPLIPLRKLGELEIQPGTFYDHEMVDPAPNTMLSLEQVEHLLTIDAFLDIPDAASSTAITYYKKKIRDAILGFLVFLSCQTVENWAGKWDLYTDRWGPGDIEKEILQYSATLAKKRMEDGDSLVKHFEMISKYLEDNGLLNGEIVDLREEVPVMTMQLETRMNRSLTDKSEYSSSEEEGDTEDEGHHEEDDVASETGTVTEKDDDDDDSSSSGSEDGGSIAGDDEKTKDNGTGDDDGKSKRSNELAYSQRLLASKFIIVLDLVAKRYKEAATLIKVDLREHIKTAWKTIKSTRHPQSKLWYDYTQEEDTIYYRKCNVSVYSLGHQVTMWKTTLAMARLCESFPKLKSKDDSGYLDSDALRSHIFANFIEKIGGKSRFLLRREGHKRSFTFSQEDVILLSPSQNENFFVNGGVYDPAWLETLRVARENADEGFEMHEVDILFGYDSLKECKLDLARYFARRHGDRPGAWAEEDILSRDNATDFIGITEEYTSMANLFTIDEECTMIWFVAPTWLLLADYPLLSVETQEKGMKRILKTSQSQIGAGEGLGSKRGRNLARGGKVKKHNKADLTAGDREKVYNPPAYGSRVWYEFPRFFDYIPDPTLDSLAAITAKLRASKNEKWVNRMHYVWTSKKAKNEFFENLDLENLVREDKNFRRTLENDIWTIDWRAASKTSIKNGADIFTQGALGANRLQKKIKRRLINIYDCRTEILLATMLFMDELERDQLIKFLNHIRTPDTHKMDLIQLTLMPENLWVTEFNISFVAFLPPHGAGWANDHDSGSLAYASKRRSGFYSLDPTVPESELPMLTDAVYAFRFVGDLHDRMWTCWKIRDLGYVKDREEKAKFLQNRSSDTPERIKNKIVNHKQRRVLEGTFVKESLRIIIKETNRILDELDKQMADSEHTGNDPLLPAMLKNEDLDGENYYVTMNKHGVYYPWIIQLCSTLKDKCVYANNASKKWMEADKTWDFKPRWTERDQSDNKEALKKNNMDVIRLQAELDQTVRRIRSKSEKVSALKESLASELSLREARTATQQADSINQFTVVTVIFVPLGFATSVVSIQEFEFSDPVTALLWIMIPITVGTIVFLINLPIIYLHFCLLMKSLQNWLRKNMTSGEIRWEFWSNRSKMLYEAEKRNTTVVNNTIHRTETNWWYWHYFTVFLLVLLPVRELRFANEVIHGRRIKRTGILKKIARMIWAPLWILLLFIDYIVILFFCILAFLCKGIAKVGDYLWNGPEHEEQFPLLASATQSNQTLTDGASIIGVEPAKMAIAAVTAEKESVVEEREPLWKVPVSIMKLAYITKLERNKEKGALEP